MSVPWNWSPASRTKTPTCSPSLVLRPALIALTVPEKAARPPSIVPSLATLGSIPPWISLVARIVIWVGCAAQPETASAVTAAITASILESLLIVTVPKIVIRTLVHAMVRDVDRHGVEQFLRAAGRFEHLDDQLVRIRSHHQITVSLQRLLKDRVANVLLVSGDNRRFGMASATSNDVGNFDGSRPEISSPGITLIVVRMPGQHRMWRNLVGFADPVDLAKHLLARTMPPGAKRRMMSGDDERSVVSGLFQVRQSFAEPLQLLLVIVGSQNTS